MAKNIAVEVLLRAATREYVDAMRKAAKATTDFNDALARKKFAAFSTDLTRLTARIAAFAASAKVLTGLVDSIIDAGVAFGQLNRKLTAATGSAVQARAEYLFLAQSADKLGLNLLATADGYANFAAAARGTAIEGQKARDVFLGVSQATAGLGLSADNTRGIFTALTQIMSKGKVQAEELTGQLGERLPGALAVAARGMGKTTAELYKMLEQGNALADDFVPKFANQLREDWAGAAQDASNSIQASFNRLDNATLKLKTALATSGITDAAAEITDKLTELANVAGYVVGYFGRIEQKANAFSRILLVLTQLPNLSTVPLKLLGEGFDYLSQKAKEAQQAEFEAAEAAAKAQRESKSAIQERGRLEEQISAKVVELAKLEKDRALASLADVLRERRAGAETAIRILKRQLSEGEAAERDYVEKIKALRQELTDTAQSDADRIRELRRRGLSEAEQQADIEAQAAKKIRDARRALLVGEKDLAAGYAETAKSLAGQIDNSDRAVAIYKRAATVYKQSKEAEVRETEKARTAQVKQNESTRQNIAAVEEQVTTLKAALAEITKTDQVVKLTADVSAAQAEINRLQAQIDKLSQTIKINAGAAGGGPLSGFAGGGAPRRLRPGLISGPGTSTSDSILARVSRGEHAFITRADRASKLWPLLNGLNFGSNDFVNRVLNAVHDDLRSRPLPMPSFRLPAAPVGGYASGGPITFGLQPVNINFSLEGGTQSISLLGERSEIERFERISREAKRGRRRG